MSRDKIEGARFDRFTGTVQAPASPQAARKLVHDIESYANWLYGCLEVRVLKGDMNDHTLYIYFIYASPDLPWYLFMAPKPKKRDMVLRLDWKENPATGRISVKLENVDPQNEPDLEGVEIPSDPDLVTVKRLDVSWEFVPGEENTVMITHGLYLDPNHEGKDMGIINKYAERLVKESLKNARDRLGTL